MKFPSEETFRDHDGISDEKVATDLKDTQQEIERLRWLADNIDKVTAAFQVLGFARSLASLEILQLDISIGNRIMFCDCLLELQRLRAESTKSIAKVSAPDHPVLKLGSKMREIPMDECSDGPTASQADEILGRQHYTGDNS